MKIGDTMTGDLVIQGASLTVVNADLAAVNITGQLMAGTLQANNGFGCYGEATFSMPVTMSALTLNNVLQVNSPINSTGVVTAYGLNSYGLLQVRPDLPNGNYSCAAYVNFVGGGQQYGISMRVLDDGGPIAIAFNNSANAVVGSISQNASGVAYNVTSDARLKTDPKSFDAGAILDQINVYDFQWIATGERAHGVFAQEVEPIYPEPVHHDVQGDVYGVDYSKFVPLLLQEIKALRLRVAQLEGAAANK